MDKKRKVNIFQKKEEDNIHWITHLLNDTEEDCNDYLKVNEEEITCLNKEISWINEVNAAIDNNTSSEESKEEEILEESQEKKYQ